MFAVREEVEVLKEKIAELMDRINQLEVENTILKANASQETLLQLSTATVVVTQQPTAVVATASPVISQIPPQQLQTQLSAPSQQAQQSSVASANSLAQATIQVANISPNQPAS
jgi:TSC-22/dip/bun family